MRTNRTPFPLLSFCINFTFAKYLNSCLFIIIFAKTNTWIIKGLQGQTEKTAATCVSQWTAEMLLGFRLLSEKIHGHHENCNK